MLYPAWLKVTLGGSPHIFSDPKALHKTLKEYLKKARRGATEGTPPEIRNNQGESQIDENN